MKKKEHSNLIGFSGKLNAGKDFSAMITQWLVAKDENIRGVGNLEDFVKQTADWRFKACGYQTHAFANTIKEMMAVLLGVPRAQLEDREYKNTVIEAFGKTPRQMMQSLGTEWGRDLVTPNIWAAALLHRYSPLTVIPNLFEGEGDLEIKPNWLITDVRFPNEVEAIKKAGGIVIRVDRPTECRHPELWDEFQDSTFDVWDDFLRDKGVFGNVYHPSEIALDGYYGFDHTLTWRDDETDLIVDLETILTDEGAIQG